MKSTRSTTSNLSMFWFTLYATSAAFITYFSMYAFRKPFSVGSYTDIEAWNYDIDFKAAIVLAQVLGYAASKFIGIKVISEMSHGRRGIAILALVMAAQLALVLFAVVPPQWKVLTLFLNGLPLGMIWGLVFSFLEGRRVSEILGAGLSISFIISSGMVKTVGSWLMLDMGVSQYWMPAVTGMIFTLPLFIGVFFLVRIPRPTAEDIAARNLRQPMDQADRKQLFLNYMPGLVALILTYMMLTAIRDYSDNFAVEIWTALGYGDVPGIFSTAALYTSFVILVLLSMIFLIKDNMRALMSNHLFIVLGVITVGLSTWLYQAGLLSGHTWMITHSCGIYLAYIPFNCLLFDRLLSVVNDKANAGFLIYIADSMGYAGSVGILLYKQFFNIELSWLSFMISSSYVISIIGVALVLFSANYFYQRLRPTANVLAI